MIVRRLTTSLFLGTIYVLILCVDKVAMSKNGRKLSRSHFEFSIDLYRQLSEDFSDKNLVFSPYSVNSLLSMLFLGTSSFSNSSRQLRQALHFDNISYVDVHKSFKEIVKNFDDTYYKSKLQMANGVFYQKGMPMSSPYLRALEEFYMVKTQALDFRGENCSQTIAVLNDWVRNQTEGQISQILSLKPPTCESKLFMLSGVALKAHLLNQFQAEHTFQKGLFFLPGNKRLEVPMMSGRFELPLGYSRELECSILEMPFAQKRISLFLLLPDDPVDGINQLERNLTSASLKSLFSTLKDEVVNVRIPRFEISSNLDLKTSMKKFGLEEIFNKSNLDFSLIAQNENIFLTSLPHKASFRMTETDFASSKQSRSIPDRKGIFNHYFEADHPFVFLVWDYFSGMLILMGKVVQPTAIY